jgi:hypothetical protein
MTKEYSGFLRRQHCPSCNNKLKRIGYFINSFVAPHHNINFYSCSFCNIMWEFKHTQEGYMITDVMWYLKDNKNFAS